jgi:hypothetical protein
MLSPPKSPTPYDGSSTPFTIGLKPLDLAEWLDMDASYDVQMRVKRRLYAKVPDKVFVAEPGTQQAQREVLDLVHAHVIERFPNRFRQDCKGIAITGHPALSTAEMRAMPPLKAASLLVQEDLILMRKGDDGWRLAAGSLCFPSSWTLSEKFGRPLHEIHRPVPGFGPDTRNNELINRMFDRLHQPVLRFNWSIQAGDALYHPLSHEGRVERAETRPSRFGNADLAAAAFIRVERQTLRKLPESGDILFTIRIHLDPLGWIANHPDRRKLAASFAAQLGALDIEQLDYKGLTADRDRLVETLESMAAA